MGKSENNHPSKIFGYVEKEPLCFSYEEVLKILSSDNPVEYLSVFVLSEWLIKYNPTACSKITAEQIADRLKMPVSDVVKRLSILASNDLFKGVVIEA